MIGKEDSGQSMTAIYQELIGTSGKKNLSDTFDQQSSQEKSKTATVEESKGEEFYDNPSELCFDNFII
jgi:hypothetical protein